MWYVNRHRGPDSHREPGPIILPRRASSRRGRHPRSGGDEEGGEEAAPGSGAHELVV